MKTLAIVIGNNNYQANDKLVNAVNDAQELAKVFRRLNYDVIEKVDLDNQGAIDILEEFSQKISLYDATIFFFAGHGFELDGENYFTTVECQIPPANTYHAKMNSIGMSDLLNIYKKNPNKINIVIVDACRKAFGRGTANTFAPVKAPRGTLIAFSTSPEDGALDEGHYPNNSVYTGTLLEYIGREMLSVEELFKKVRKTVYYLTKGKQTPWEHTSLIDDFYFNGGQLIYSLEIPYSEEVVKDAFFQGKRDEISRLIDDVRTPDWNKQNPAFDKLLRKKSIELDKNQQFILGRNLLQAGSIAFEAQNFFKDLENNLKKYNDSEENNHVLNGILFEIYFNNHGDFRKESFKLHNFEEIVSLRKVSKFQKSFEFIQALLSQFKNVRPFWIPTSEDKIIDVNIKFSSENVKDFFGKEKKYDIIESVNAMSSELLEPLQRYNIIGRSGKVLKPTIAHYLGAPFDLVKVHFAGNIDNIAFPYKDGDEY